MFALFPPFSENIPPLVSAKKTKENRKVKFNLSSGPSRSDLGLDLDKYLYFSKHELKIIANAKYRQKINYKNQSKTSIIFEE